jgi:hypothetical protein
MDACVLVRRFASELGWRGLERTDITLTPDICSRVQVATVFTCFSTTDSRFFIQINQHIPGRFGLYDVSIVAERYGIRPTDFVKCELASIGDAISESVRLSPMLARVNFKNRKWRRQFLERNPSKIVRNKKWRGWKGRFLTQPSPPPRQPRQRRVG